MEDKNNLKIKKYSCLKCGECCGAWNLPVENDLYETLMKTDFVQAVLLKNSVTFEYKNGQYHLPKKAGLCIFLDQLNKSCLLQAQLGIEYKPLECLRFPFAYARDTNAKLYYDTSFYCNAILKNEGDEIDLASNAEELSMFDLFSLPEKIILKPCVKITFAESELIIGALSSYIYNNCLENRLENWFDIFLKVLTVIDTLKANDIDHIYQSFQQNKSIYQHNNFKIQIIKSIALRKKNLLFDVPKIFLNLLTIKDPLIAEQIKLDQIDKIMINQSNDNINLLLRYYTDILERKVLYAHGHSIIGKIVAMIIAAILVEWYSKVLAYCENLDTAETFHIETAIKIVERYYIGHNVKFMELFRNTNSLSLFKTILLIK